MTATRPFARATPVILISHVVMLIGGCADLELPPEPTPVTPVPESLSTFGKVGYGYFKHNGKKVRLVSVTVDGNEQIPVTYLEPGPHKVITKLRWSNSWTDETELAVEVEARHRYAILSFELAPGQAAEKATLTLLDARPEPALWQYAAGGAANGALIGALPMIILTAPVWGPVYAISQKYPPPPPTGRPFENCCFVWIQDVDSGAVVAGSSPAGAHR